MICDLYALVGLHGYSDVFFLYPSYLFEDKMVPVAAS